MNPCIAIIDQNTLSSIALKGVLSDMFPAIEIRAYRDMVQFIRDADRYFVHYFVSEDILFSNMSEFEMLRKQTIVLSKGGNRHFERLGFYVLDICCPEPDIIAGLLRLHAIGHPDRKDVDASKVRYKGEILSAREKEVLRLIVMGYINKEIADMLDISITTVIYHRNNICEKLGTRSIGRLTIFAVLSGLVDINDI